MEALPGKSVSVLRAKITAIPVHVPTRRIIPFPLVSFLAVCPQMLRVADGLLLEQVSLLVDVFCYFHRVVQSTSRLILQPRHFLGCVNIEGLKLRQVSVPHRYLEGEVRQRLQCLRWVHWLISGEFVAYMLHLLWLLWRPMLLLIVVQNKVLLPH